ncbi:MAG: hypothetical protein EOP84_06915, partial [Verrucomicrobiaceae bacterium]
GFAGTESTRDQRNWKVNQTIFSGELGLAKIEDNSRHLITCADVDSSTKLDGIYFESSYSIDTPSSADYAEGGAIAALRSSPAITNCVFRNNWARKGAAVWSHLAANFGPTITGCEFSNNVATENGGALFYDSALWVANSRFFRNSAPAGGAISATAGGYCIIQQSLFWGNSATLGFGGAISSGSDNLVVSGSTIYKNRSTANVSSAPAYGGGIYYTRANPAAAYLSIYNSILFGNTATNFQGVGLQIAETDQVAVGSSETVSVEHSILEGLNRYAGAASAANLDADPQFVDPKDDITANFALKGNSSAINAGKAAASYTLNEDLAGAARVLNGTLDIGPYEYAGSIPTGGIGGTLTTTRSGSTGVIVNQFAVTLPAGSAGFQWQVDRGNGVWATLGESDVYSGVATNTLVITGAPFSENGYRFRLAYNAPGFGLTYYSSISRLKVGLPRIYVKASAGGIGDGSSWTNAYSSLRDALEVAEAGSQIWVAAGIYYPTKASEPSNVSASLKMHSGVAIYGGFIGTESNLSERNPRTNITILSGKLSTLTGNITDRNSDKIFYNDGRVLSGACDRTAILDGFTITDAAKYGILNDTASPTIRNCIFRNNLGPAIFNWNDSNAFVGNSEFHSNTAPSGGAIYNSDSSAVVENSLFADNVSTMGRDPAGAVRFTGKGTSTITHCTFVNNSATLSGAAITVSGTANVSVRNSVVWGNTVSDSRTEAAKVAVASSGTLTISNSCLQGATSTTNGNFTFDPLFVDPTQGNYQVARLSPLLNAASPSFSTISNEDLLGNGRDFSGPDIGAYELNAGAILGLKVVRLPVSKLKVKTTGGGSASFSMALQSGTIFNFTWQVNHNDGAGWVNVADGGRYDINTDGSASILTISGIEIGDNGLQVRVVNPLLGDYSSPASVVTVIQPTILYVNQQATAGLNNGTSWANAYTNLAAALSVATENYEVWVAKGTYTAADSAFVLPDNVEIYGGFAGGESLRSAREWENNETVLRPASGNPTVYCNYSTLTRPGDYSALDGFIFEDANSFGAVYIRQRNQIFQNCVFRSGVAGVVNKYASPTFINCVFSAGTGCAVQNDSAGATFSGCRFDDFVLERNTFVVSNNNGSTSSFTDCVFSNNTGAGSISDFNKGSVLLTRCQFLDNVG